MSPLCPRLQNRLSLKHPPAQPPAPLKGQHPPLQAPNPGHKVLNPAWITNGPADLVSRRGGRGWL